MSRGMLTADRCIYHDAERRVFCSHLIFFSNDISRHSRGHGRHDGRRGKRDAAHTEQVEDAENEKRLHHQFQHVQRKLRLAHPFTKPCEEVICLERIMPMQNSAQGADVEPSMADIDRIGFGTAIWSRLTAAPSAE